MLVAISGKKIKASKQLNFEKWETCKIKQFLKDYESITLMNERYQDDRINDLFNFFSINVPKAQNILIKRNSSEIEQQDKNDNGDIGVNANEIEGLVNRNQKDSDSIDIGQKQKKLLPVSAQMKSLSIHGEKKEKNDNYRSNSEVKLTVEELTSESIRADPKLFESNMKANERQPIRPKSVVSRGSTLNLEGIKTKILASSVTCKYSEDDLTATKSNMLVSLPPDDKDKFGRNIVVGVLSRKTRAPVHSPNIDKVYGKQGVSLETNLCSRYYYSNKGLDVSVRKVDTCIRIPELKNTKTEVQQISSMVKHTHTQVQKALNEVSAKMSTNKARAVKNVLKTSMCGSTTASLKKEVKDCSDPRSPLSLSALSRIMSPAKISRNMQSQK